MKRQKNVGSFEGRKIATFQLFLGQATSKKFGMFGMFASFIHSLPARVGQAEHVPFVTWASSRRFFINTSATSDFAVAQTRPLLNAHLPKNATSTASFAMTLKSLPQAGGESNSRKLVIAIDFGTTWSGVAWAQSARVSPFTRRKSATDMFQA